MDRGETILSYILKELADDLDLKITKETSLFQDRVLDSLNLVALINFMEKTFDIKIRPSEVNIENLDSVSNMLKFLDKKLP
jgi:acyl carrier protein